MPSQKAQGKDMMRDELGALCAWDNDHKGNVIPAIAAAEPFWFGTQKATEIRNANLQKGEKGHHWRNTQDDHHGVAVLVQFAFGILGAVIIADKHQEYVGHRALFVGGI
jgi:hypothetical protein